MNFAMLGRNLALMVVAKEMKAIPVEYREEDRYE